MPGKLIPAFALLFAAIACDLPGAASPAATLPVDVLQTAVAATLTASASVSNPGVTASAPTPAGPATEAPAAPTAAPTLAPPTAVCFVAIADGSTVLCQNGPDQIQVADTSSVGTVGRVAVSPDGGLVAYTVAQIDGTAQLWAVNADGSNARKLVGKEQLPTSDPTFVSWPRLIQWQAGTHTLFFDTGWTPIGGIGGPGEYINADLWKVDADTGDLTQLLTPGSGGLFSVSPNGQWVAVSRPEDISLISADGSTVKSGVLTFPAVITYSEYAYKPQVTWSADGAFFVAPIPSHDPMAADASTTLYRVTVDGAVQQMNTIAGGFLFDNSVKPSPDGQWVAYIRTTFDGTNNHALLQVAKTDGSLDNGGEVPTGANVYGWSPDSVWFAYSIPDDGVYVAGFNGAGQPFAQEQVTRDFVWTDAMSAVFSGQLNGHWGVRTAQIGGAFADIAGPFSERVVFDVRR